MDAVRRPSPGTLLQTPHRVSPGFASHHRGTAQETRPSDDLVQLRPRDNSCLRVLRRRTRRLLRAGALIRMSGGRLPKRNVFGNLEGAVRRGQSVKEKEWNDCVQSDTRAFGIAGDWKATALEADVRIETATEGGRRFMAARKKEEVDALEIVKRRERQRDWESCYPHGSVEPAKPHQLALTTSRRSLIRVRDGLRPA